MNSPKRILVFRGLISWRLFSNLQRGKFKADPRLMHGSDGVSSVSLLTFNHFKTDVTLEFSDPTSDDGLRGKEKTLSLVQRNWQDWRGLGRDGLRYFNVCCSAVYSIQFQLITIECWINQFHIKIKIFMRYRTWAKTTEPKTTIAPLSRGCLQILAQFSHSNKNSANVTFLDFLFCALFPTC